LVTFVLERQAPSFLISLVEYACYLPVKKKEVNTRYNIELHDKKCMFILRHDRFACGEKPNEATHIWAQRTHSGLARSDGAAGQPRGSREVVLSRELVFRPPVAKDENNLR
jgi:hypothetical protein